jgi:hypothetical protein
MKHIPNLWAFAPLLKRVAAKQARALREALKGRFRNAPGFRPWHPGYYPEKPGCHKVEAHRGWAIGYHAGRLFSLRELAYDGGSLEIEHVSYRSSFNYQLSKPYRPVANTRGPHKYAPATVKRKGA